MLAVEDQKPQDETAALVAKVAACRVLDLAGRPVRLYDAWRKKPVVHVFLRQFGCLFCHQVVAELLGFGITGVAGDVAQLGGIMVVRPPARLAFLHRSHFAGDHPSIAEVVAAV